MFRLFVFDRFLVSKWTFLAGKYERSLYLCATEIGLLRLVW